MKAFLIALLVIVLTAGPAQAGLLDRVNQVRARHGLEAVQRDGLVSRYADHHTQDMVRRGYLFHSTDDQLRYVLRNRSWSLAGEDVGVGASPRSVFIAFLRSPTHRAIILDSRYAHVGIGVERARGDTWVTLVFWGP